MYQRKQQEGDDWCTWTDKHHGPPVSGGAEAADRDDAKVEEECPECAEYSSQPGLADLAYVRQHGCLHEAYTQT